MGLSSLERKYHLFSIRLGRADHRRISKERSCRSDNSYTADNLQKSCLPNSATQQADQVIVNKPKCSYRNLAGNTSHETAEQIPFFSGT